MVDHDRPHLFTSFFFIFFFIKYMYCKCDLKATKSVFSLLKVVKLPTRNQPSGHSEHWGLLLLEAGRIWTSASFCTENIRNWGGGVQMSLVTFVLFFFVFCVLLHFQRWKCYFFTVLFGTFLILMYCMVVFYIMAVSTTSRLRALKMHSK